MAGAKERGQPPTYFATPEAWRAWLKKNHATAAELLVGFYKTGSGRPSITWPQSVDEALCFGWIDGVRRSLGADAYTIRFTPRRPGSAWSAVNVAKVEALTKAGKMQPAGVRAFSLRTAERTGVYSFERDRAAAFSPAQRETLAGNRRAATFFQAQPPWYQRAATHWVISAKREETQARRLKQLIADSAAGRHVPPLRRPR
jgi:uncharacterized protein YdeI (YjbR/CyaY-like superfamily)